MSNDDDGIALRPARPSDAEAVAKIWYDGWRDGHLGHVPDELTAVRTEESFGLRAPERVRDTVVAIVDDAVAGFVMVVGDEVEQVYVSRHHRGTGVATALLTEAERLVEMNGHERAWLAVVAGNARARRFYERSGWIDDGPFEYLATNATGPIPVPCRRYVKHLEGRAVADNETQIRALIERWAGAVHQGDLDDVLADHTDDIVMFDVPPPNDGVRGIDAYRETWPSFFTWQRQGASFDIVSLDITAGDDIAFAYALLRCGTQEELRADPDNRLRLTIGLRKENGRWVVAHEHHSFPLKG